LITISLEISIKKLVKLTAHTLRGNARQPFAGSGSDSWSKAEPPILRLYLAGQSRWLAGTSTGGDLQPGHTVTPKDPVVKLAVTMRSNSENDQVRQIAGIGCGIRVPQTTT
jgi:hypothetical protein